MHNERSSLNERIEKYNKTLAIEAQLCFDAEIRKQNERNCEKLLNNNFDASDAYLQHANMQSAYLKAVVLADVYFCEDTRAVLKSIEEQGGPWWEIDLEKQGLLLRTMKSEIQCGLYTDSVVK